MDITYNTSDNNTVNSSIKTPEPESETQTRIQSSSVKPLPFTNGLLKRHQPLTPPAVYVYKECLKNHAAALGGHSVDGCGEFMCSPSATPTDPTSLKCAACGCHRNFHRRFAHNRPLIENQPPHRHHPPAPRDGPESPNSPSPPPISSVYYPASAPHMLLALSTGLSGPQPDGTPAVGHGNGRKRVRTKFSQNQKEKMVEFAEKMGWRIQKREEDAISEFCKEIGVDRGVLKVWMHNNKSNLGKKSEYKHNGNGSGFTSFGNHEMCGNHNQNNSHSVGSLDNNGGVAAANGAHASSSSS